MRDAPWDLAPLPPVHLEWYVPLMSGTYATSMGDRGRLVIPAELRERAGLTTGTPLILLDSRSGVVVMTRAQAREHLRRQLQDADLVRDLLAERRRAAEAEDGAA